METELINHLYACLCYFCFLQVQIRRLPKPVIAMVTSLSHFAMLMLLLQFVICLHPTSSVFS